MSSFCLHVLFASLLALSPLAGSRAENLGQTLLVSISGTELDETSRGFLQRVCPAGVVLFRENVRNANQLSRLTRELQKIGRSCAGREWLIAMDVEGGSIRRFSPGAPFSDFPSGLLVAATGRVSDAAVLGRLMAEQLRAVGVNFNLAPVADLEMDWSNRLIRGRTFGSEPEEVANRVEAFVAASQAAGVVCAAKHFPGHGAASGDSHRRLARLDLDASLWRMRERVPFAAAVRAGVAAVMLGHIWAPSLDRQERPASLSPAVIGLLREELGFGGLVLSDALSMGAVKGEGGMGQVACQALAAGADALILGAGLKTSEQERVLAELETCRRDGRLAPERIRQALSRVRRLQARIRPGGMRRIDKLRREHAADLARIFADGITLLRDRDGLLPLGPREAGLILAPGRFSIQAQNLARRLGGWSSRACDDKSQVQDLIEAGRRAERIVVLSLNAVERPELVSLIEALPPERTLVVALESPYDLKRFPEVGAYLAIYHPVADAWQALADVLTGLRPARGRLPVPLGPALPTGFRLEPAGR